MPKASQELPNMRILPLYFSFHSNSQPVRSASSTYLVL